jgi:hypothetical protein
MHFLSTKFCDGLKDISEAFRKFLVQTVIHNVVVLFEYIL